MSEEITAAAQAAFAAYHKGVAGTDLVMPDSWDMQPAGVQADWLAATQAAAKVLGALESTPLAAEPEPAKVIVVTEVPFSEGAPRERRYAADSFEGDSSGLDIKRAGRVIATYPGEHAYLSVREEGAIASDGPADKRKLAIALDTLREMQQNGDEAASEALAQIADADL